MLNKRQQNKISTPGYFIKRLRDNKFAVVRVFQKYGDHDPRRWTVLVDPSGASIFITCYSNKNFNNDIMFEFNDGGNLFVKNFSLTTESIEVVIQHLIRRNVQTIDKNNAYYAERNLISK